LAGWQILLRWACPRFRYDQVMRLGWKMMLPAALLNVAVTAIVIGPGAIGKSYGIFSTFVFFFLIGGLLGASRRCWWSFSRTITIAVTATLSKAAAASFSSRRINRS